MLALAELQQQFLAALLGREHPQLLELIDAQTPTAAQKPTATQTPTASQRLAVYRNNWRSNLRNALRATCPVVECLVGAEFFGWMADQFIDQQPSHSGNLDNYGAEFPAFIRDFAPATELPYLADVAQLEVVLDALRTAADVYDDSGNSQPLAHILESHYPIHRIWQVNQPSWQGEASVSLDEGGVQLLIQRLPPQNALSIDYDFVLQPLSAEQMLALDR